jgi:hypothetical protein
MRNQNAFLCFVVMALAVLVSANPAGATDPEPATQCTTTNGWAFSTDGPEHVACPAGTCTEITYVVGGCTPGTTSLSSSAQTYSGGSSFNGPDHVFTFLRYEAGMATVPANTNQTSPCGGDSTLGIASGAICHERILRFNSKYTKACSFTFQVAGKRLPITTSIGAKKGYSQGACKIVGIGFEDTSSDSCIETCGAQNTFSARANRVISVWQWGPNPSDTCDITDYFSPSGDFLGSSVPSPCVVTVGEFGVEPPRPVSELSVNGETVQFGDGVFVAEGSPICQTKWVNGSYRTVCK